MNPTGPLLGKRHDSTNTDLWRLTLESRHDAKGLLNTYVQWGVVLLLGQTLHLTSSLNTVRGDFQG